jgi:hypothetical protein
MVVDRRRRERPRQQPLARTRVHPRSATPTSGARLSHPQHEIPRLGATRPIPRHIHSAQEPAPPQQRHRVRPNTRRREVTRGDVPQIRTDLRNLCARRVHHHERQRPIRTRHHPTDHRNNQEADVTHNEGTLSEGHEAVSQHNATQNQATQRAVVRSTTTQRRYLRAAYTVYEDRTGDPQPIAVTPRRAAPAGFTHALARLTALQRRVVQLRYLDLSRRRDKSRYAASLVMPQALWERGCHGVRGSSVTIPSDARPLHRQFRVGAQRSGGRVGAARRRAGASGCSP